MLSITRPVFFYKATAEITIYDLVSYLRAFYVLRVESFPRRTDFEIPAASISFRISSVISARLLQHVISGQGSALIFAF